MSFLSSHRLVITGEKTTPFVNSSNVFPDGAAAMFRDADGLLWAMCGHTHMGEIAMFRGTCLDDMQKLYPIRTLFATGNADAAFCGVVYPEGIRDRCGWIAPITVYPGEMEQDALALSVLRALRGEAPIRQYLGRPVWNGFEGLDL